MPERRDGIKQRAAAKTWLAENTSVNMLQQSEAAHHYDQMAKEGKMERDSSSVARVVSNLGSYAQAYDILANPPPPKTRRELQKRVDAVQHHAGPSWTEVGDLTHDHTSAAESRVRNNGLYTDYVPENMTEEQQMAEAIARSAGNDDDAMVGVVEESAGNSKMPPLPRRRRRSTAVPRQMMM